MEAFLHYKSKFREDGIKKLFEFNGKSESCWTLEEDWLSGHDPPYCRIILRAKRETVHRFYYADVEIYTHENKLVLQKTSKGDWREIKIIYELTDLDLMEKKSLNGDAYTNNTWLCKREIGDKILLHKIKLHPILELSRKVEFLAAETVRNRVKESLLHDVGMLLHDPRLNTRDVVIRSAGISVAVHRNILFARLPSFSDHFKVHLDEFKVSEIAASGLRNFVSFLYDGKFQPTLITTAELAMTAKAMFADEYKRMFLDKLMVHLSVDTVVYVLYITHVCEETEYYDVALWFLDMNLDQIVRTQSWFFSKTCYNYLVSRNAQLLTPRSDLEVAHAVLYQISEKYFKIFYS